MTQYFIWVDENNKAVSNPKPYNGAGELPSIFKERRRFGKSIVIGSQKFLQDNFAIKNDYAFEEKATE